MLPKLPKLLAWVSLATALLAAVFALAGVFAGESLGDMASTLILWTGLPLLVIAILLTIALLVIGSFNS